MIPKFDAKKELEHLYHATADVVQVHVPPLLYLMVDGRGDPNTTPEYSHAVEALFSVAYTAKFMVKRSPAAIDYAVMPLEGRWWSEDLASFANNDRANWQWTMMIMQPTCVAEEVVAAAIEEVRRKKRLPAMERLRLAQFAEGHCAQVLHVGPFTEEGPTVERLHAYIRQHGDLDGKHHEIYLSDIRRADPRRWKTIIRQPMRSASSGECGRMV